ncbi:predicted protein, partial [Nematostella vectensis]
KCGIVVSWKRVQGANGKLQAFGFCEYSDPEASLRAIRLLHNLQVGDKSLVLSISLDLQYYTNRPCLFLRQIGPTGYLLIPLHILLQYSTYMFCIGGLFIKRVSREGNVTYLICKFKLCGRRGKISALFLDKKALLLVKVDAKTKTLLDEYKAKKKEDRKGEK